MHLYFSCVVQIKQCLCVNLRTRVETWQASFQKIELWLYDFYDLNVIVTHKLGLGSEYMLKYRP